MIKYIIGILFLFVPTLALATTADTCSQADVESAITATSSGGTVIVPSCSATSWASSITIIKSITVQGQTSCLRDSDTYEVTCSDNTTLSGNFFDIDADNVRISGITYTGTDTIQILDRSTNWRVDNIHFNGNGFILTNLGYSYGVFDTNLIENNATGEMVMESEGENNTVDGPASWARGGGWDDDYTLGVMIVEDCEFDITSSGPSISNWFEGNNGGRWVVRYSLFSDDPAYKVGYWFEVHGTPKYPAGHYSASVYNCKLNSTNTDWHQLAKLRGGRNLIYGNTLTGWTGSSVPSVFLNEDDCGTCGSYPCDYQINNSYVFDNTGLSGVSTDCATLVEDNRDYWTDTTGSNFSTGVASSRPETCTDDDVYWETDNEKLYRCDGTNNWILVYTPYTYPHPLRTTQLTPGTGEFENGTGIFDPAGRTAVLLRLEDFE